MSNPFGMKCRDVVAALDTGEAEKGFTRVRVFSHLLLCHACRMYFKFSRFLSGAARALGREPHSSVDLRKLEERLLKSHSSEAAPPGGRR